MTDLLIRGGTVIDGTGTAAYRGDVAVTNGRVTDVGTFTGRRAMRMIDARGKVVAPGFIDIHSHSDESMLVNSAMESALHQGVTLVVPQSAGGGLQSAGGEGIEVVLAAGSAWGIDRSQGQVLWRRSVGDGGPAAPLKAGGQVFLVDRRHEEVASVEVATGQLQWRLPVAGGISGEPQVLADQLVVTTRGGGVLLVDRASGEVRKGASLPQAARTAAIVEPSAAGLWQVADFGLAYRLSAGDLAATEVVP